jgi:hypothetical protein
MNTYKKIGIALLIFLAAFIIMVAVGVQAQMFKITTNTTTTTTITKENNNTTSPILRSNQTISKEIIC